MTTKTQKISNFLDNIDSKCRENFVLRAELSVNESIVKFKGQISFISYNPQKPTKWCIRIYVLVDPNIGSVRKGLVYPFVSYRLRRQTNTSRSARIGRLYGDTRPQR